MWSNRETFEDDACPVGDDLLGELYRANENGLPELVESVSSEVRAMLALFCYRRSHLQQLALTIAGSCNERDLVQIGGRAGLVLYDLAHKPRDKRSFATEGSGRKSITLSTKPLSTFAPDVEDDFDDDLGDIDAAPAREVGRSQA